MVRIALAAIACMLLGGACSRPDDPRQPEDGKAAARIATSPRDAAVERKGNPSERGSPPGRNGATKATDTPGGKSGPPPPLPVSVIHATPRAVPVTIEAVGQAEGSREVEVRSRVSGIIEARLYEEGAVVRAGAAMFRIDPAPLEIALAQARAAGQEAEARARQAEREAERLRGLVEERAISQREFDDATAQRAQTRAALARAEASVREAELNLSWSVVRAPIGGIAGRATRSEGSLVTANTESSLLTTIVQADPVWVRFSIAEPDYQNLRGAGRRDIAAELVGPEGRPLARGRVNFAASTVDTRLGTVAMRAEFRNPGLRWLPGEFARVRVFAGTERAVLVPQSAVVQDERGRQVWVVDDDDTVHRRAVDTGRWIGADLAVTAGLAAGDRVVVDNLVKLRPGMAVIPRPAEPPPAAGQAKGGPPS